MDGILWNRSNYKVDRHKEDSKDNQDRKMRGVKIIIKTELTVFIRKYEEKTKYL